MTHWDLRVGADTDVGRRRQRNEDSFCVLLAGEDIPSELSAVLAVADGMGGHDAGDVASAFVVDAIRASFGPEGELRTLEEDLAAQLAAMLRRTNVDLHAAAVEQGAARGMGSTITLAVVRADQLVVAHVGDSRLYRFRAERLEQITEDHSWTAEQRRRGLISEEEEAHHPRRNLLTDCIGVDREIAVFTTSLDLLEGDRFLLCSDGLYGPISDDEIAATLATPDPETAASLLVERANEAGGPDNITAVVLDVASAGASSGVVVESGRAQRAGELDGGLSFVASNDSAPADLGARDDPHASRSPHRLDGISNPEEPPLPDEDVPRGRLSYSDEDVRAPDGTRPVTITPERRFVPRWTLASAAVVLVLALVWGWTRSSSDGARNTREGDPAVLSRPSENPAPGIESSGPTEPADGSLRAAPSESGSRSSLPASTPSLKNAGARPMDSLGTSTRGASVDSADTTR